MLSGSIPDSILKAGSNVDLSYNNLTLSPEQSVYQDNIGVIVCKVYMYSIWVTISTFSNQSDHCLLEKLNAILIKVMMVTKFLEKSIEVPIWFTYDFLPHEKANVNQLCTGASLLGANKTIEATLSAFTFGLPVSEAEDQVH
ncbi:hypothetical protein K1719_015048 [Acacia pycnantha]|nr:hypothetical protein K1719_015048 [Acacia pycnantha]